VTWYPIEPIPYRDSAAAGWLVVSMFFGLLSIA
jgi:hypothetical protein